MSLLSWKVWWKTDSKQGWIYNTVYAIFQLKWNWQNIFKWDAFFHVVKQRSGETDKHRRTANICIKMYSASLLTMSNPLVQWCRRRGCKRTPKIFICRKFGQDPWKSGQKWPPTLFDFKQWRSTFAEKHMKTFNWSSYRKGLHDLCGRKFVGKVVQNLFG